MTQDTIVHPATALAKRLQIFATVAELINQIDETTALQLFARAILLGDRRSPMHVCADCNLLQATGNAHLKQIKHICTACHYVHRTEHKVHLPGKP